MELQGRKEMYEQIRERLVSAYRAARRADVGLVDDASMVHEGRLLYLWSRMDLDSADQMQRILTLAIGLRGDLSRAFGSNVRDEYRGTVRHYLDAVESLIEILSGTVDEMYDRAHPGDFGGGA